MEGVETGVADKGKGKAPAEVVEESGEDESSDESGVEDQVWQTVQQHWRKSLTRRQAVEGTLSRD